MMKQREERKREKRKKHADPFRRVPSGGQPTIGTLELRAIDEYSSQELTVEVLKLVAVGAIVLASFAAPNLAQLLRFFPTPDESVRKRFVRKMRYLKEGGYLVKRGERYILSEKSRAFLSEDSIWKTSLNTPSVWDGRWHLVLFDLPGVRSMEKARQALRARLEQLGFVRYQDSVYIHAHDMREALLPFISFYRIGEFLRMIDAVWVAGEEALMTHYRVRRR